MRYQVALCLVALLGVACRLSSAAPYYYFYQDPQAAAPEAGSAQLTPAAVGEGLKDAAEKAQEQAGAIANGASAANANQLPHRLQGHLSELYSHGSTAMKGVVETVQPDLKNIGKDISEASQAFRAQVEKRIEPLAQTIRPYIDHAQKVMAPIVSQARQEVPKLMEQAKPTVIKMHEHVRDRISGVIDKLKSSGGPGAEAGQQLANVQDTLQHQANSVQQQAEQQVQSAGQAVQNAASAAQQQLPPAPAATS